MYKIFFEIVNIHNTQAMISILLPEQNKHKISIIRLHSVWECVYWTCEKRPNKGTLTICSSICFVAISFWNCCLFLYKMLFLDNDKIMLNYIRMLSICSPRTPITMKRNLLLCFDSIQLTVYHPISIGATPQYECFVLRMAVIIIWQSLLNRTKHQYRPIRVDMSHEQLVEIVRFFAFREIVNGELKRESGEGHSVVNCQTGNKSN